jgi:amidase
MGVRVTGLREELRWLDATAQADLVRRGEVSAEEVVEAAIERIEALDGPINAVIHRTFDAARAAASGGPGTGPFAGVPFLVKDLYAATAGDPLHNGNKAVRDAGYVAPADSELVGRWRGAGFVLVGRTNTPEFGLLPTTEPEAHGATSNPWDPSRSPGGSSGGAAAAVAAGMVPAAHASDGGGSIRIPASACGLVGLKVSRGRTSLAPAGDESGLSVQHAVTRSVRDSAAILDATAGPAPGDMAVAPAPARPWREEVGTDPGRLRIGLLATSPAGELHPECRAAALGAGRLLESLGHHVEESHPAALDHPQETGRTFLARWSTGARTAIINAGRLAGRELGEDDVEPPTWLMASIGDATSGVDLALALAASAAYTRELASWWAGGFDLLVSPVLGEPPWPLGDLVIARGDDPVPMMQRTATLVPFTTHFNISGQPAISLPLHWTPDGLPVGVQLVAAYGREDLLIRVASQLEAAAPWADRRPPEVEP